MKNMYTYINEKGENGTIPELLLSLSGRRITNTAEWETFRRKEIKILLSEFVYGFAPIGRPDDISFSVTEKIIHEEYGAIEKRVDICFGGYTLPVRLFVPQNKTEKVPCFIHIYIESQEKNTALTRI